MKNSIIDLWSKIEAFTSVEPDDSSLNEPLSSEEISQFKKEINMDLPEEFFDSLQIHNGSEYLTFCRGTFYSMSEIKNDLIFQRQIAVEIFGENEEYKETIGIKGPIKRAYWSYYWVPFFCTDWSTLCIDLDPAEGGTVGQIIEVDRETRDLSLVSNSYLEFLQKCVDKIPADPL